MKQLTQDQALILRELRPKQRKVTEIVEELIEELAHACDDADVEHCPTCHLLSMVAVVGRDWKEMCDVYDDYLQRGPDPEES